MSTPFRWLLLALSFALLPACGDNLGAPCFRSSECGGETFCCTESKCAGGMCTLACGSDRDCPGDMFCRDAKCFYACESDRDCEEPFRCHSKDGRLMCIVD